MLKKIKFTIVIILLSTIATFAQKENLEIVTDPFIYALYKDSGNEAKIISPSISNNDNIRYTCTGGIVIKNEVDPRLITIVPNSPKVTISIFRDTTLIGIRQFGVRLVPFPTIKVYADSSLIQNLNSNNDGMNKNSTYFTVNALPDESYKYWLPKDSKFVVKSWQLFLMRNDKQIDSLSFTTETGNIKRLLLKAKPGDKVYLEVYKVIRIDFRKNEEDVKSGTVIKTIRLE